MHRATNYFGTQWDTTEFTLLYKTLYNCKIMMLK